MGTNRQELDFVAELRLRQWARRNYVEVERRRDGDWHPVVLEEMRRMDRDQEAREAMQTVVTSVGVVPLEPSYHTGIRVDQPHAALPTPHIRSSVNAEPQVETFIPYYG